MADKLKWNSWGWFLGNAGGLWVFGKLARYAGQAGDPTGACLMAAFVLMQCVTILYPWLRRATIPPGRAAVVHVVAVLVAVFVAIGYFHWIVVNEKAQAELRLLPWIIGVILFLILGLIALAKIDEAKQERLKKQAVEPVDLGT